MDAVEQLLAESSIRSLIGRVALLGDIGAPEDYASVYADDAVWEFGSAREEGISAIIESARQRRAAGTSGPGSGSKHVVTVMDLVLLDSDHARVTSYFVFYTGTSGQPSIGPVGTYSDQVARRDGVWKITRRVSGRG
jgi:hypothetical protein